MTRWWWPLADALGEITYRVPLWAYRLLAIPQDVRDRLQ